MSVLLWDLPEPAKPRWRTCWSQVTSRRFVELSASGGRQPGRAAIEGARAELGMTGTQTLLFIDEVHRFNKAQQDALLPAVENRWVSFVGATTENPSFSVIGPLMSRSLLLTLRPIPDEDMRELIDQAVSDERGLGGSVRLADEAAEEMLRLVGGDARRALTYLESAALGSTMAA
jgi:putative ATPase